MIITFFLIWGLLFVSHMAYSYKFLYRPSFGRPRGFYGVRRVLFFLHVIALIILSTILITKGEIVYVFVVIVVTFATGIAVRRIAYNRVVRELFTHIITDGEHENISRKEAWKLAKKAAELSIRSGV